MDTNIIYDFEIDEVTLPDYKVTRSILEWLRDNLSQLKDDNLQSIFNKVNLGYNESSLKGLGKKPVCDIYLSNIEYKDFVSYQQPESYQTVIVVSLKGNANNTYAKGLELHDYILQEFIENKSWRELSDIVQDTKILNSEVQINGGNKVWGTLILFELQHILI